MRASSAVPGVFSPVPIAGRTYVDGGLVAPVPVEQAREMGAELVIAVDISSPAEPLGQTDPVRVLLQTFTIMGQSLARYELKEADIVIRFQGGANAGHTIINNYGKFALHTLPSGVYLLIRFPFSMLIE